jgi:hypothetical protein
MYSVSPVSALVVTVPASGPEPAGGADEARERGLDTRLDDRVLQQLGEILGRQQDRREPADAADLADPLGPVEQAHLVGRHQLAEPRRIGLAGMDRNSQ